MPVGSSWLQLGLNCAELSNVAQLRLSMRNWWCVGAFGAGAGPKTGPMRATWPCTMLGSSGKKARCHGAALSPQNWPGLSPTWPRAVPYTALQLGPKLRCLAQNWSPSWRQLVAEVGPKAIQMDCNSMPCDANGSLSQFQCAVTIVTWHLLAAASHQVGPNEAQHGEHCFKQSVIDSKKVEHASDNGPFEDFGLGQSGPHFEAIQFGPNRSEMDPSWGHASCTILEQVGPKFELIGSIWAEGGAFLAEVDLKLG